LEKIALVGDSCLFSYVATVIKKIAAPHNVGGVIVYLQMSGKYLAVSLAKIHIKACFLQCTNVQDGPLKYDL